ncbi:MAG: glycosyltransferase 87 family protein [Gaiellaceae bacterium]
MLAGSALVLLAGCVAAAWLGGPPLVPSDAGRADGRDHGVWVFLGCLAGAFVLYLGALAVLRRARPSLVAVVALAAAIQLAPLAAPLLLSTDAWTYWEYGEIAAGGGDPYRDVPSEFPGNPAYDHAGFAWRETTSVYGPAFTLGSELVARSVGSNPDVAAWTFKLLGALGMLALTGLATLLARDRVLAAALVGWNPLFAIHFAGGGHNDSVMLALVLGALALAASRRRGAAGAAWALAILVKWIPLVFFALRALEARSSGRRVGHLGFALTAALVAALACWRYGLDWLRAFGPLARNAEGQTSYALPHRLEQLGLPRNVTLVLAAAVLTGGLVLLAREALRGRVRLGRAGCLLLATTPWLAPWYAVWALPLAAAEGDRKAQLVALGFCAYLLPQTIL